MGKRAGFMNKNLLFLLVASVALASALVYASYQVPLGDVAIPLPENKASKAEASIVTDANNEFALKLYSYLSKNKGENVFFSPWSISTAFSLVGEGARGDTAEEIRTTFSLPDDSEKNRLAYKTVQSDLNRPHSEYSLDVANAVWVKQGYDIKQEYLDVARTYYDGHIENVDFTKNGVDIINDWVRSNTNNKIEKILESGSTDDMTALVVTNAIYFKGEWVYQFNPDYTSTSDFHIDDKQTVKAQMMELTFKQLNHMQNDMLEIIELPYKGDRISMLILLPRQTDGLAMIEQNLSTENLASWRGEMSETGIAVFLPRFTAETTYDLNGILQEMGMSVPFDMAQADFSGINESDNIYIGKAVHKAFVDVGEKGTEAAAATGIEARFTSGPPAVFRADHPFIFVIEDNETGNILFIGRVVDPTV